MAMRRGRRTTAIVAGLALALGAGACGDDETTAVPAPEEVPVGSDVDVGEDVRLAPDDERRRAMERAVREAGGGRVVAIDFDMDDDGREDEDGDGLTSDRWTIIVEEDGDRTRVVFDRDLQVVFLEAL